MRSTAVVLGFCCGIVGSAALYSAPPSAQENPYIVEAAGNTALLGAKLALFGEGFSDLHFGDLRKRIECVSLASDPTFQRIFIEETLFPKT